jgi:hypothetical protein
MTMLGRSSSFILLLVLLAASLAIAPRADAAEAYHGTVIDAETKKPIEGAVVVVVWYRKPVVSMDGPQYFHNAFEVLTDVEGKFSITADPGIDWNPLTFVLRRPSIAIFKPGYGPFPVAHVSPRTVMRFGEEHRLDLQELNDELLKGTVVELQQLRKKEELREFTSPGAMWISTVVPHERIPNLIHLINIQARRAGVSPYQETFERDRNP